MPHMPTLAMVDITMASVKLMPMPRFWLPVTHMPPPMVPSPMLWLPQDTVLSTLPMLDSAPTTLELPFPAKHFHQFIKSLQQTSNKQEQPDAAKIVSNKDQNNNTRVLISIR